MGFFDRNKIEKSENQEDSLTEDRQNKILERPQDSGLKTIKQ